MDTVMDHPCSSAKVRNSGGRSPMRALLEGGGVSLVVVVVTGGKGLARRGRSPLPLPCWRSGEERSMWWWFMAFKGVAMVVRVRIERAITKVVVVSREGEKNNIFMVFTL